MANPFDPKAKYKQSRDVREWDDLFARVQDPPDGLFWPVLGPRRSGKTWALKALEARSEDCTYIDARDYQQLPAECSAKLILLDEPGSFLFEEPPQGQRSHRHLRHHERTAELFAWCQMQKQRGASIVAAVTASEWCAFPTSGRDRVDLNELDSDALAPLTAAQARALAGDEAAGKACVEALLRDAPDWLRNPLLLTVLLHCRCKQQQLDLEGLFLATRKYVEEEFDYTAFVLYEGFDPSQQEAIRATARNQNVAADVQMLLIRSGVTAKDDGVTRIADPVLAKHLPAPTRIHHISDLHFGSKTAQAVDGKDESAVGQLLAQGAGAAPVRDDYLDWLTSLHSRRRPNIVVVSGDLAEWARPEEFEEAHAWLSKLVDKGTAAHPEVGHGPRLLFVGGNHDVDWGASQEVAQTRHERLASYFPRDAWHRPGLELAQDDARRAAHIRYPKARVAFALLGSAQFSGQGEGALGDRDNPRDDPGLVHDADLDRVRQEDWEETIRIAVLHHPVSHVPGVTEVAKFAGLINAGNVKDALLEQGFCLVLHGHVHTPWIGRECWPNRHDDRTLTIVSAATLGSKETYETHGFNEVCIYREGNELFIEVQAYKRSGQGFEPMGEVARIDVTPG